MIAVSQNMVSGISAASNAAGVVLPEKAALSESGFWQVFATAEATSGDPEDACPLVAHKPDEKAELPDEADAESPAEIANADGLIWPSFAPFVARLAVAEAGANSPNATSSPIAGPAEAEPMPPALGEQPPNLDEPALAKLVVPDVAPLGVASDRPPKDLAPDPKKGTVQQAEPTTAPPLVPVVATVSQPAKVETSPSNVPPQVTKSSETPPQNTPDQHGILTRADAPYPAPKSSADVFTGPVAASKTPPVNATERVEIAASNTPHQIHQPTGKAKRNPHLPSSENAWRQKWMADDMAAKVSPTPKEAKSPRNAPGPMALPPTIQAAPAVDLGHKADMPTAVPDLAWAPILPVDQGRVENPSADTASQKLQPALGPMTAIPDPQPKATRPQPVITDAAPTPEIEQAVDAPILVESATKSKDAPRYDAFALDPAGAITDAVQPTSIHIPTMGQHARTAHTGLPAALAPTIVDMARTHDHGPLQLALSPEELGRLTISIKQDGNSVHITVIADRPETLDLMRRHGHDLVADLRQAGFSDASLSFGQGDQGQQPRFADTTPDAKDPASPQPPAPETKLTAPARSHNGSGMDLRF